MGIYYNGLALLALNIVLYFVLSCADWLIMYLIFSAIVDPICIFFHYFCFGGKEKEKLREIELQNGGNPAASRCSLIRVRWPVLTLLCAASDTYRPKAFRAITFER